MNYDFSSKSVIVTGAARGIGFALAKGFREAGADVVIVDRDEAAIEEASKALGAAGVVADVSETEAVERVVADCVGRTGRLDIVVNNAGITRDAMLWKLSDEDWDVVLKVHLGGTFRFTRAAVPHFRAAGFGRIINVTSYTGMHGNIGQANYAAAKAGIIGFTKTAAKELARFGITVNAISPNARTAMVDAIPEDKFKELEALVPLGRFAEPGEMWPAVALLASEEASYITGIVLPVDGGVSM